MDWIDKHPFAPAVSFDGGDLDCGSGLLLLIRQHIDPLEPGQLLEIKSTDATVDEDLPAWCRLTKNELVSRTRIGNMRSFLVSKGPREISSETKRETARPRPVSTLPEPSPPPPIAAVQPLPRFAVMGIGSWPRPRWLLKSLHDRLSGRLSEEEFQQHADDAVQLAVVAQERAGVDVVTDGEQRRDNYASFVGGRLDNCQLIPITDLLPYVTDPAKFAEELRALDVPAEQVRHPAVFGKLSRSRPLAVHELARAAPVHRPSRQDRAAGTVLVDADDVARMRRRPGLPKPRRIIDRHRAALFARNWPTCSRPAPPLCSLTSPCSLRSCSRENRPAVRSCAARSAKRDAAEELAFAGQLIRSVLDGFPRERLALHICRGNWSRDESVALSGPYTPLLPLLQTLPVGTFFLEMATPRAGELSALRELPGASRLGLGVVNQKLDRVEAVDEVVARAETAVAIFGPNRVLLNPDCGFATFADNPLASAQVAEQKLAAIVEAACLLRRKYVDNNS